MNELQAMIFDEEFAYDAQKILAPPKRKILEKQKSTPKFLKRNRQKQFLGVEK